jgi:hypothetical protein
MAACGSTIEPNTPRRSRRRVRAEKKPSTAFSHEPEVGVKRKVQRGCRASHSVNSVFLWAPWLSR